MLSFTGSRISPHLVKKSNGTLIALSVPIAREGAQTYRLSELGVGTSDEPVTVIRPASEVFDKTAIASFEGCPIVDEHPGRFLDPSNWAGYSRGHAQNIRPGPESPDGRLLLADLVVHDGDLIAKIENGKRGISCGYECEYVPNSDGTYSQRRIRGNHIAVVPEPRAGEHVRINDGVPTYDVADFAEIARRYHRQNVLSVSPAPRVRTHAPMEVIDMGGRDWGKMTPEQMIREITSIRDGALGGELHAIENDANFAAELMRSGVGPGTFAAELAKRNAAYASYQSDAERGAAFEEEARAAGAKMQGRCVDAAPVRIHRRGR